MIVTKYGNYVRKFMWQLCEWDRVDISKLRDYELSKTIWITQYFSCTFFKFSKNNLLKQFTLAILLDSGTRKHNFGCRFLKIEYYVLFSSFPVLKIVWHISICKLKIQSTQVFFGKSIEMKVQILYVLVIVSPNLLTSNFPSFLTNICITASQMELFFI
jgi:hypothetical protein